MPEGRWNTSNNSDEEGGCGGQSRSQVWRSCRVKDIDRRSEFLVGIIPYVGLDCREEVSEVVGHTIIGNGMASDPRPVTTATSSRRRRQLPRRRAARFPFQRSSNLSFQRFYGADGQMQLRRTTQELKRPVLHFSTGRLFVYGERALHRSSKKPGARSERASDALGMVARDVSSSWQPPYSAARCRLRPSRLTPPTARRPVIDATRASSRKRLAKASERRGTAVDFGVS